MPQSDNFSIDELAKIAEYYVSFDRSFNGLNTCSLLQKCAGIVSSEDSGLSQSCAQAAKTLEEGTKAINLMGGSNHNIANNTFEGDLLDGVSIASGASNVNMTQNTFIDNWMIKRCFFNRNNASNFNSERWNINSFTIY